MTSRVLSQPFECVIVESPLLATSGPEPEAFAEYFRSDRDVVRFENLGKDALLVAPCPGSAGTDFGHLFRFITTATDTQISSFWRNVGEALDERVGNRPLWLSTAGLGVSWLHVRLDSHPKYYRHVPYKTPTSPANGR